MTPSVPPGQPPTAAPLVVVPNIVRGEIYWINIPQAHTLGGEQYKRRPWVVVSSDKLHRSRALVIAVPLTTKIKPTMRRYWFVIPQAQMIPVPPERGLTQDCMALTEQLRALSHARIDSPPVARVTTGAMAQLEACIKYVLQMP